MKPIKLEGAAFEAAMDLHRTALTYYDRLAALQEEMARLQTELHAALKDRWPKVLEAAGHAGADPADFALDVRYLCHGLMFLSKDDDNETETETAAELPPARGRQH